MYHPESSLKTEALLSLTILISLLIQTFFNVISSNTCIENFDCVAIFMKKICILNNITLIFTKWKITTCMGEKKHNGTVIVNVKLTSPSSWKIKLRKKNLNKVTEKLFDLINERVNTYRNSILWKPTNQTCLKSKFRCILLL